ncbi:MAG: lipopolysaccharide biosynthesis protein [Saprospiraceae bacterium]
MGVIQRQGIKHSIVNFAGLAVGVASTLFVYSRQEVVEGYGLAQFLLSICMIGFPLFSFASSATALRFYPYFEDKASGNRGFLTLLVGISLVGWGTCAGVALLFWENIRNALAGDAVLLQNYLWVAFPLSLLYMLATIFVQFSANFQRIVVPSLLFDFSLKLALPSFLVALWLGWLGIGTVLWLLLVHFSLVVVALIVYLRKMGHWFTRPDWGFLTPKLRRDMASYAGFVMISGLAVMFAVRADMFFVGSLTDMKSTGVYAIALNIAVAIDIPIKGLHAAAVPFMTKYLAEKNWVELRSLYQKVSINLITAGLLLFGCIWVSVDDLYSIMPNSGEVSQGKYVLLFLCIGKLIEMAVSLNGPLVYYSQYYRYSLVSYCLLALANVGFNLWLIPLMGLPGAAVATLLSISCYNLFGLVLVWAKFRMQPFSRNMILAGFLALLAVTAVWFLPSTGFLLLNIALRSGLFALLFAAMVIRFRVSADIVELWGDLRLKISKIRF